MSGMLRSCMKKCLAMKASCCKYTHHFRELGKTIENVDLASNIRKAIMYYIMACKICELCGSVAQLLYLEA